jgi:hypothetical protein
VLLVPFQIVICWHFFPHCPISSPFQTSNVEVWKAVPALYWALHHKDVWGSWCIDHEDVWGSVYIDHVFLTGALVGGEWSTSRPGRFIPKEIAPGNHWIRGCEGPEPVWTMWRGENSWPQRDLNSDSSVVKPLASRYADCIILASQTSKYQGQFCVWNSYGTWSLTRNEKLKFSVETRVPRKIFSPQIDEVNVRDCGVW